MKKTVLLLLCCLSCWGQDRQARGRQIVEEALAALGGERYLAMQNRVETGRAYSFYRDDISGLAVTTIYTKYVTPAAGQLAVRERQAFGKEEESATLFTGDAGYQINYRGARPLGPEAFER
jgi:hypothetical protein